MEYVSSLSTSSTTSLTVTANTAAYAKAIVIDETRAFVVCADAVANASGGSGGLMGRIVTFSGASIISGVQLVLDSSYNSGNYLAPVYLGDGKLFIAHNRTDTSTYLVGTLVTVSETTLTLKGTFILGDNTVLNDNMAGGIDAVVVSSTKVLITFCQSGTNNNYELYACFCVISETGNAVLSHFVTKLCGMSYSGSALKTFLLSETRVLIVHQYGSYRHLHGLVISLYGGGVQSIGTEYPLCLAEQAGTHIGGLLLDSGDILITHASEYSGTFLMGMVLTVSDYAVSISAKDTMLSTIQKSATYPSVHSVGNGVYCVLHGGNGVSTYAYYYHNIYATILRVGRGCIYTLGNTLLHSAIETAKVNCMVTLSGGNAAFRSSSNRSLMAYKLTFTEGIKKCTSKDSIFGISKANCAEGATTGVVVPNI